jgi:uncharacterized protein YndB with AHSA1/START domain
MSNSEKQFTPPGTLTFEGDYATITFTRRIRHPPERVWSAITEPEELKGWYMTRATVTTGRNASVDFVTGPSHFHVSGRILSWDPPRLFEHEWKVAPRPELPSGEDSIARWELTRDGNETLLTFTFRRLTRDTAIGFAPGMHAFLDRLEVQLEGGAVPEWMPRVVELRKRYPESQRRTGPRGQSR